MGECGRSSGRPKPIIAASRCRIRWNSSVTGTDAPDRIMTGRRPNASASASDAARMAGESRFSSTGRAQACTSTEQLTPSGVLSAT